jgi:hypothetical protein
MQAAIAELLPARPRDIMCADGRSYSVPTFGFDPTAAGSHFRLVPCVQQPFPGVDGAGRTIAENADATPTGGAVYTLVFTMPTSSANHFSAEAVAPSPEDTAVHQPTAEQERVDLRKGKRVRSNVTSAGAKAAAAPATNSVAEPLSFAHQPVESIVVATVDLSQPARGVRLTFPSFGTHRLTGELIAAALRSVTLSVLPVPPAPSPQLSGSHPTASHVPATPTQPLVPIAPEVDIPAGAAASAAAPLAEVAAEGISPPPLVALRLRIAVTLPNPAGRPLRFALERPIDFV